MNNVYEALNSIKMVDELLKQVKRNIFAIDDTWVRCQPHNTTEDDPTERLNDMRSRINDTIGVLTKLQAIL